MPYIITRTTKSLTDEKIENIKTKFGKAIETFPGKTEKWLMVDFEDECKIYFRGDNDKDSAFVEVKIFGTASKVYCEKMTDEICDILFKELQIDKDRIYVKYEEVENWGWNSSNF